MSGTGFPSSCGLGDPAAWATPVQPGVPDTRQVPAEPIDVVAFHRAVGQLDMLGPFLAGWQLSAACKNNGMDATVQQWRDALKELYALADDSKS